MLEELDKFIIFIQQKYDELTEKWVRDDKYTKLDLKKTQVKMINENNNILDTIFNYRVFINEKNLDIKLDMKQLDLKGITTTRVKLRNSIEFKLYNYNQEKHENGKIPINKCLNDIYGLRIVFKEGIIHEEIKKFVNDKYFEKLKCIDSTKPNYGYVATHIYFRKGKYNFPWELQIWDEKHKESNIKAHEIYKQEYVKWEKEVEGGALI